MSPPWVQEMVDSGKCRGEGAHDLQTRQPGPRISAFSPPPPSLLVALQKRILPCNASPPSTPPLPHAALPLTGYLVELHKFSKFIHGTATLFPEMVRGIGMPRAMNPAPHVLLSTSH